MPNNKSGFTDVDTIISSQTITKSFIKHLPDFVRFDSEFSEKYADELLSSLKQTADKYLNLNKFQKQVEATKNVYTSFEVAKDEMLILKSRIKTKFPETKNDIYRQLGLHINLQEVHNKKQEALIALLFGIKKGLENQSLFQLLVDNNIPAPFLEGIIKHANTLQEAEINQETEKLNTPTITKEASAIIYEHYRKVNGICEIAKIIFRGNQLMLNKFTWSYIIDQMHSENNDNSTDENPPTEEDNNQKIPNNDNNSV